MSNVLQCYQTICLFLKSSTDVTLALGSFHLLKHNFRLRNTLDIENVGEIRFKKSTGFQMEATLLPA